MVKRDYYKILGVSKNATLDEIKRAYRKLAKKYHPDMYKGDKKSAEKKFKEISEAYEILSDPAKRQQYDRLGDAYVEERFGPGGFDWTQFTKYRDIEDIFGMNIFDEFFRNRRRVTEDFGFFDFLRDTKARKGSDVKVTLDITLDDVFHGNEKLIKIRMPKKCSKCSREYKCPTCKGEGHLRTTRMQGPIRIVQTVVCPTCRGTTRKKIRCSTCDNTGWIEKLTKVAVKIRPGIHSGYQIKIPSGGRIPEVRDGMPGDLYVEIRVLPHKKFNRKNNDLYTDVKISFVQAALGDDIIVKTIDNQRVKVKIPAGTQTHTLFRIPGKGMPKYRSSKRGDMFVRTIVTTPTNLTDKQKKLLREALG
jgi:molecular chaperone DnaJ